MGVSLERVQNKFACIIGELCNEPYVLSQFAIWVDLRIAEYKANGAIQLDCTGDNPNPLWLKGMGPPDAQKTEALGRDEDLKPSRNDFLSTSHSHHPTSDTNQRLDPDFSTEDLIMIKTEPADVYPMALHTNSDFSRKRRTEDRDVLNSDNSIFPPVKSRRFSPAANEETESFLSVIGVPDQPSTSHAVNSDNFTLGAQDYDRGSGDFNTGQDGNDDNPVLIDQNTSSSHLSQNSSLSQIDVLLTTGSAATGMTGRVQQPAFAEQGSPVPTDQTQGFERVTDSDVFNLIRTEENHNTARKTIYDLKVLKQYLNSPEILESRDIFEIPAPQLNKILSTFFVSARKANGDNYEPSSLRSMLCSFERYLKRHGYKYSLISDLAFYSLRQTIKSKQMELRLEGKGLLPNKADPATDDEIDRLWQSGQFGSHSPIALINSMWFFTNVHFGLRSDKEHRNLCWGDVSLCNGNEGREYLEFHERHTKTRTGGNPCDVHKIIPKMWDEPLNPSRCPVAIYKKYRSLRPIDYCNAGDPFYIATNSVNDVPNPGEQWFKRQPIGVNKIGSLMKTMAVRANLSSSKITFKQLREKMSSSKTQ